MQSRDGGKITDENDCKTKNKKIQNDNRKEKTL